MEINRIQTISNEKLCTVMWAFPHNRSNTVQSDEELIDVF